MKIVRWLPLLCVAAGFLAGGCDGKSAPQLSPAAVTARWWSAVAAGDGSAAADCVADSGREKSGRMFAEYALVRKAAEEKDPLAEQMLKRLEGIRTGEEKSGPTLAVVQLVMADGKPFLRVLLESRNGGWRIVDLD